MAPTDREESKRKSNEVEVEEPTVINIKVKRPRMKSVVCVPAPGGLTMSQDEKDRLINNRNFRRTPKNIDNHSKSLTYKHCKVQWLLIRPVTDNESLFEDLFEDVDLETEGIKVKSFPTERKLSSKIKKANCGIDYSNHSIEEYYNQPSIVRKVISNVQVKKKASLNDFGLVHVATKKKKKESKTDAEDKQKAKESIPEEKSPKKLTDNGTHQHFIDLTSRQDFIRQGLDEEKFQFVPKVVSPIKPKVTTNFPKRCYRLVNY